MNRFLARPRFERRLVPNESPLAIGLTTLLAVFAALLIGSLLFLPFGANPLNAYSEMFRQSFGNLRGFGFTLVQATPLIFIGLGTIVAWSAGFNYLGFEGTLYVGGAMAAWLALLSVEGGPLGPMPALIFYPLVFAATFGAGGVWAGFAGWIKARFGGNEVLISLMTNYLAVFLINYLVSGPMRAPGDLPQTIRLPDWTLLGFIIPDTRAHAGILVALLAALLVWLFLRKTPVGYELIVAGFSPKAARYSGINVRQRLVLAAFIAGGLGAMAGLCEVLGVQFRLLDGISHGTGFVGIVAALLGRLNPFGVVLASLLYAAMGVGADAMQRRAGLPSSVILIIQSLIVLLILASDLLRYYRVNWRIHPVTE